MAGLGYIGANAPCYNCEKRKISCHSNCEDYKKYHQVRLEIRERIKKNNDAIGFFITEKRRISKCKF